MGTYFSTFRITGLDPAGPLYATLRPLLPIDLTLSKEDAVFVDIIHGDKNGFGSPSATGDVDFYPNNGAHVQPGCPLEAKLFTLESNKIIRRNFFGFILILSSKYF